MTQKLDRQTTPPFLLKLFYRVNASHVQHEFLPPSPHSPHSGGGGGSSSTAIGLPPHLQIYTWKDCTLSELAHLVVSAMPGLFPDPVVGTRLVFKMFFPDASPTHGAAAGGRREEQQQQQRPPRFITRDLGSVVVGEDVVDGRDGKLEGGDDEKENGVPPNWRLSGDAEKTLADERFQAGDYVSVGIFPPLANGDVAPSRVEPEVRGRGGLREYSREYWARGGGRFDGRLDPPPRDNGFGGGGYGGRGPPRGLPRYADDFNAGSVPRGEWSRGEQPPGPNGGGGGGGYRSDYGSGRGRGPRSGGW